jgi:hypothetical protein
MRERRIPLVDTAEGYNDQRVTFSLLTLARAVVASGIACTYQAGSIGVYAATASVSPETINAGQQYLVSLSDGASVLGEQLVVVRRYVVRHPAII